MKQVHFLIFAISVLCIASIAFSYNLSGNVYDPEKSRLSSVTVTAFLGETKFSEYAVDLGYYQLDVPSGTFFIKAEKSGYLPRISKLKVAGDMVFDIVMFSRSGYYLYGRVIGNSLPESIDLYVNGKRSAKDTLSENGLFMFSGLPKGSYELRAVVDGQSVSEKVALGEDTFIQLRVKKVDTDLRPLQEVVPAVAAQDESPTLVLPETGNVGEIVKGYVLFPSASQKIVKVVETGLAYALNENVFHIQFDKPGTYTVSYAGIAKSITIKEKHGSLLPSNPSNANLTANGWSVLDYLIIVVLAGVALAGAVLALYSFFFRKSFAHEPKPRHREKGKSAGLDEVRKKIKELSATGKKAKA